MTELRLIKGEGTGETFRYDEESVNRIKRNPGTPFWNARFNKRYSTIAWYKGGKYEEAERREVDEADTEERGPESSDMGRPASE